jgi:hypothetical protein
MSSEEGCFLIVGMQRSGTSALSGALARLGVCFGNEEMLYAADSNNLQGYFEHRKATAINLRILDEFQMHVTSFGGLPSNWSEHPQSVELRGLLRDFIKDDLRPNNPWGIKNPLASLLMPIYRRVFQELGLCPNYLVCVRNPLESMASEASLEFGDSYRVMQSLGTMAIGSWLRYTLGAICEADPDRLQVVPYDELLANPRAVLESVVAMAPTWRPNSAQWEDALGSVRTDLRRNRTPVSKLDHFPSIVGRTYEAVTALGAGQASALSELRELYAEFQTWTRMLGDPPSAPGQLNLTWVEAGERRYVELRFEVTSSWQTISVAVDAPPKTPISGSIYGRSARVWIRRCVWSAGGRTTEAALSSGPCSGVSNRSGMWRLDAAPEAHQIRLVTPGSVGPYKLELEFLLEAGTAIDIEIAASLAQKLGRCVSSLPEQGSRRREP